MHLQTLLPVLVTFLPAVLGAAMATCQINNGQNGVCMATSQCKSSGGTSEAGHCPGGVDNQCCTYGACKVSDVAGSCQPTASCTGTHTPGFCPGPTDIQCCTESSPPPGGGGGSGGGNCPSPTINEATVSLIKEFEGFTPTAYPDPDGHPTIGIGHLCDSQSCSEIKYDIPLSASDAEKLLNDDLVTARNCITKDVRASVELNPNQYGALVSWAFNVGCTAAAESTLVARLNAGEDPDTVAGEELPRWNRGDSGPLPGLTRRRAAEVKLFQTAAGGQAHPPVC